MVILEADGEDIAKFASIEYAKICMDAILDLAIERISDNTGERWIRIEPMDSYLFDWDLLNKIRGSKELTNLGIYIPTDCEYLILIETRNNYSGVPV